MKEEKHESALGAAAKKINLWQMFAMGLLVSNVMLGMVVFTMNKPEKTIVTPPEMRTAFWVEGDKVAPEYLLQMSKYFVDLLLSYNPESAPGQFDEVLKYVDPTVNNAMRRQLATDLDEIKSKAMSSVFWTKQMKPNGNSVIVFGTKRDMMAGSMIGDSMKAYQIDFAFKNRLVITGFKQIEMMAGGIEEWERNKAMAEQAAQQGKTE